MLLFFFARTKEKPSGKEESANAVTDTRVSIIYSELRKPVDCLDCARKVVTAKSSPYLLAVSSYVSLDLSVRISATPQSSNIPNIKIGMKANSFHISRCVTACFFSTTSARLTAENGMTLKK